MCSAGALPVLYLLEKSFPQSQTKWSIPKRVFLPLIYPVALKTIQNLVGCVWGQAGGNPHCPAQFLCGVGLSRSHRSPLSSLPGCPFEDAGGHAVPCCPHTWRVSPSSPSAAQSGHFSLPFVCLFSLPPVTDPHEHTPSYPSW